MITTERGIKFAGLAAVAVIGSLVFGAAAGLAIPHRVGQSTALLLTLSTGCSWLLLGAFLVAITRKDIFDLAEACLTAMAYGEAVLVSGAVLDVMAYRSFDPVALNIGIVLASNVVMATVFCRRLRKLEVSLKVSLSLWLFGLNGSWPIFFLLIARLMPGEK
jgi:hypothetical protein